MFFSILGASGRFVCDEVRIGCSEEGCYVVFDVRSFFWTFQGLVPFFGFCAKN